MVKQDYALDVSRFIEVLKQERDARNNDGLYHYIQIKFAYNSNKMEGSTLSEEQTRHIFNIGEFVATKDEIIKSNDVIETVNHFKIFDYILDAYKQKIDKEFLKNIHYMLKNGIMVTEPSREIIGNFKVKANFVGDERTTKPSEVSKNLDKILEFYENELNESCDIDEKLEKIIDLHYNFEKIHPFYDGNGRVGRILLFKECLNNDIVPFIIADEKKAFYLRGLKGYSNTKGYLIDTCLDSQDQLIEIIQELEIDNVLEQVQEKAKNSVRKK